MMTCHKYIIQVSPKSVSQKYIIQVSPKSVSQNILYCNTSNFFDDF